MVKIYTKVLGKRISELGVGENLTAAVMNALENGYLQEIEGVDTSDIDKVENYILGAVCDYEIVDTELENEGVENMSNRDLARELIELGVVDEFLVENSDYIDDYLDDFLDREFMFYDDQWTLLQELTTPSDLLQGRFTIDEFYEAVRFELENNYLQDIDELECFIEFIRENGYELQGLELIENGDE